MKLKIVLRTMVCAIMWWGHCSYMQADEVNSISEESSVFYVDDFTASKQSGTRSSSEHWKVSSVIKNCFDQENIGQEAWLMTADGETQLSVTLEYLGDDDRYKIVSQEAKFYFYEGADLFHDDSKILITDVATYVGSYTTEGTEKTATVNLMAPSSFPYMSVPYYTYYAVIEVEFANGGTASVAKKIGISRVGVIILHGLNDSSVTFVPMRDYLLGTGQFLDAQIYIGDYKGTNTSSFAYNTHTERVVEKGLEKLSDKLFAMGIASTKFDMVGHSMGGILFRLYNQEIDNGHTNKIITLNTPHFGAPMGNFFSGLVTSLEQSASWAEANEYYKLIISILLPKQIEGFFMGDRSKHAISDLAYNSEAIKNLNSAEASKIIGIPVFAIGTQLDVLAADNYFRTVPTLGVSVEMTYLLAHLFSKDIPKNRQSFFLDKMNGDGVVSVESQKGGVSSHYSNIYSAECKWVLDSEAFHCNSPKWNIVHDGIRHLLLSAPDEKVFCMSGFGTPTYYSVPKNVSTKVDEVKQTEFITYFAEPKGTSFIDVSISNAYNEDYTHIANLSHSDDMITTMVFASLSGDAMIAEYDRDVVNLYLEGYEGEVTFYAIGRTNYDALVIDSVKVNLTPETKMDNISNQDEISYSANNGYLELHNVPSTSYTITIYDMLGDVLMSMQSNLEHCYALPNKGQMLIVELKTDDEVKTLKIYNRNEK